MRKMRQYEHDMYMISQLVAGKIRAQTKLVLGRGDL